MRHRASCNMMHMCCVAVQMWFVAAGHLTNIGLQVDNLLCNGLLDAVMGAYVLLKQKQLQAGANSGNQVSEILVQVLLGRSVPEVQRVCTAADLDPLAPQPPQWVRSTLPSIITCLGNAWLAAGKFTHCTETCMSNSSVHTFIRVEMMAF